MQIQISSYCHKKNPTFPYHCFVEYIITPSPCIRKQTQSSGVNFRYSEILTFHNSMVKKYKSFIFPQFPKKSFIVGESLIRERMSILENYFNCLLNANDYPQIQIDVKNFLLSKSQETQENRDFFADNLSISPISRRESRLTFSTSEKFSMSNSTNHSSNLSPEERFLDIQNDDWVEDLLKSISKNYEDNRDILFEIDSSFQKILSGNVDLDIEEIYKLIFGDMSMKLNGLIFYIGRIEYNLLSAISCLKIVSMLIDYEKNVNCEKYRMVLQLISEIKLEKMKLDLQILNIKNGENYNECMRIIKCICDGGKNNIKQCLRYNEQALALYLEWEKQLN